MIICCMLHVTDYVCMLCFARELVDTVADRVPRDNLLAAAAKFYGRAQHQTSAASNDNDGSNQ